MSPLVKITSAVVEFCASARLVMVSPNIASPVNSTKNDFIHPLRLRPVGSEEYALIPDHDWCSHTIRARYVRRRHRHRSRSWWLPCPAQEARWRPWTRDEEST